jgi:hypothetical protein
VVVQWAGVSRAHVPICALDSEEVKGRQFWGELEGIDGVEAHVDVEAEAKAREDFHDGL